MSEKPTTLLLIRHGENDWTDSKKLAGQTAGVHLNDYGRAQAEALGQRLATTPLDVLYTSPLERTLETAQAIAKHHPDLKMKINVGLIEVDYGDWTGQLIDELSKEPTWGVIQHYPSGASFPNGETMYDMQTRFVRKLNELVQQHPQQTVVVVGHADLIKAAVAHYLGVHFDLFQRIVISTASLTILTFHMMGPRIVTVNDTSHNPARPERAKEGN